MPPSAAADEPAEVVDRVTPSTFVACGVHETRARPDTSSNIQYQPNHANRINSYKWKFRRTTLRTIPEPYRARDRVLRLGNLLIDTAYGAAASCGMAPEHFVTDLFLSPRPATSPKAVLASG